MQLQRLNFVRWLKTKRCVCAQMKSGNDERQRARLDGRPHEDAPLDNCLKDFPRKLEKHASE